jgi:hypothetical protein
MSVKLAVCPHSVCGSGLAPWSLSRRQLSALAGMLCSIRVLKVRRCACLFRWRMTRVAHVAGSIAPDDARKVQYTREQVDACGDPFEVEPSVPAPIRRVRQLFIVAGHAFVLPLVGCLLGVAVDCLEDFRRGQSVQRRCHVRLRIGWGADVCVGCLPRLAWFVR